MVIILPQQNIIKHFRHVNEEAHGEPETPEHLEMKKYFYRLCIDCGVPVEIEKLVIDKYGNTERIIDVLIDNKISLECQCSPISTDEMLKRGIFDISREWGLIWVFGGDYFEHTQKKKLHVRKGRKPYYIQRIKKAEQTARNWQDILLYYHYDVLYLGVFKYRAYAKTLGWYKLNPFDFKDVVPNLFKLYNYNMKGIKND